MNSRYLNIIEQLTNLYLSNEEYWHINKLSREESNLYHQTMIDRGNLIYEQDNNGNLLGYCEFLRINFEQWGRIVCRAPFYNFDENIRDGNICLISNLWIHKDYRRSFVFALLKMRFMELNSHCEYFAGHEQSKSVNLIKVFKREELHSKLFKEGIFNKIGA